MLNKDEDTFEDLSSDDENPIAKDQAIKELFDKVAELEETRQTSKKKYFDTVKKSDILKKFERPTINNLVECGYNTTYHDARIKKLEICSFLLQFMILLFTIAYYELNYEGHDDEYQIYLLYGMHLSSAYLILSTYMKYHFYLKLMKMRYKSSEEETIWSSNRRWSLMIEILIGFIHPNYFLHNKELRAYNSIVQLHTVSKMNDVLAVAGMIRVALICSFAISLTGIASNRAKRVALMHGYELKYTNIVKTLTKESPFLTIILGTLVSIITFSYAIRICERPLTDILNDQTFGYLSSSMYCVVITMMTVGYGDMYPRTLPGRILAFFLCIWGVFITSLSVVTLTNYVTLSQSEDKALKLFDKLENREEMKKHAAKTIYYFFKMVIKMKKNDSSSVKRATYYLKRLMQSVKQFRQAKASLQGGEEGMLNKSDLVSMIENLHKSINKIKDNQQEMITFNEKMSKTISDYY